METKIYERTNGGLDIIRRYFPDIKEKQKFKMRTDERTPSASMYRRKDGVYCITDFGDDSRTIDPIHLIMRFTGCTYWEAVNREADRLGLTAKKVVTKPQIHKVATTDADGITHVESSDFSEADLKFWGVPKEVLIKYGWQVCQSYTMVKDGQKTIITITDGYRMYVRNCCGFYKIYKPQDDYARFMIEGEKTDNYIHGLTELENAYKTHNTGNEIPEELEAAIICSGERDAMVVAANGYYPVWKNSESEKLNGKMYANIKKYVKRIYNIPDIDATGIKCGNELALQYEWIHTVRLPQWLTTYNNNGKPRKDLRDWYDFCPKKSDFEKLLESALTARFYAVSTDNKGNERYYISDIDFFYFLSLLNFYKVIDEDKREYFVYFDRNILRPINITDVKCKVKEWLISQGANKQLRNTVHQYLKKDKFLDDLEIHDYNTKYFGFNWQVFQFKNKQVNVSADDIKVVNNPNINYWESQIIKHDFRRIEASFTADEKDITIHHTKSHFMRYLINTSRIYWREELEKRGATDDYLAAHKFTIDGELLTADEVAEQKQNIISKIFAIGYMLHRYKRDDRAFAPWIMEHDTQASNKSDGGTGKSFLLSALKILLQTEEINSGKLDDDKYILDQIKPTTALLHLQDVSQSLDLRDWFNFITNNITQKMKYKDNKTITFEESPKLVFTSNFAPYIPNDDSAYYRRLLFVTMSDYYHYKTEDSDYQESRAISDDFGYIIMKGEHYKEEWYNEDINFMLECLQFYLQMQEKGIKKLEPNLTTIQSRIRLQDMGDNFNTWADLYFSDIEVYNRLVSRKAARMDYLNYSGVKNITPQLFYKRIKLYCKNNNIICNQEDFNFDADGKEKRKTHRFDDPINKNSLDDTFFFRKPNEEPIEYVENTLPF